MGKRNCLIKVGILLLFILLILFFTYPLLFSFFTHIPGFFSTDEPYSALWNIWRIKYSLSNNFPLDTFCLVAYPFGINIYESHTPYLWQGVKFLFALFLTPSISYNVEVLINFLLSALFMCLLVFYFTENYYMSIFSGIIFSFSPQHFVRSWQHLGLTYFQWIPFSVIGIAILKERRDIKSIALLLLALILLLSFDYSIMYLTFITLNVFLLYNSIYKWKLKINNLHFLKKDLKLWAQFIGILLFSFIILSLQFYPVFKNALNPSQSQPSVYNRYRRPFTDLFSQSAKPLSYFLPAVVHPIFGKFTQRFIGSPLYGVSVTEHTLYLGWTPILLALYAVRVWRKKRRKIYPYFSFVSEKDNFYIGFFILLAGVAWFFSQPPWWRIGSIKIYMPSFFMYKILPMFRAYCRFGIVVMLAVSVLAGFGLKFLLERFKEQKTKIFVTSLFCGLVLFEFWNWPPYKVIDVSKAPQVYYWLREKKGDFAIAEYPLDVEGPNEMYKFYQIFHHHPIINGTVPGTYANRVARKIIKLSEPKTASILKWMGVKYVLVHREDYLKTELVEQIEELKKIPQNPYLKFVRSFPPQKCPSKIMCTQKTGPIDVYEVVTQEAVKP